MKLFSHNYRKPHNYSMQNVNKNEPSLSINPFSFHVRSSFSIAVHSSTFQPESLTWLTPLIRTCIELIQGFKLFEYKLCESQDDPPVASNALRNLETKGNEEYFGQ